MMNGRMGKLSSKICVNVSAAIAAPVDSPIMRASTKLEIVVARGKPACLANSLDARNDQTVPGKYLPIWPMKKIRADDLMLGCMGAYIKSVRQYNPVKITLEIAASKARAINARLAVAKPAKIAFHSLESSQPAAAKAASKKARSAIFRRECS